MKRFVLACLIGSGAFAQPPRAILGDAPAGEAPAPAAVKPEDKCSLEGAVLNSATGEPLKKVQIMLRKQGEMGSSGAGATSDASGRFSIKDVDPGRYMLVASRNGFVQQAYGAKGANRGGPITLEAGRNMKDLTFRLIPQGVITGRIADEDGDPLANVTVQIQRYTYFRGRRQLTPANSSGTNDLGEYRLYDLAPGKYYVSASSRGMDAMAAQAGPQGAAEESYATAYYPNASNPEAAAPIQVTPGAQIRGIDITLVRTRAARVRGRVVSAITNKPIRNGNLFLTPKDGSALGFMNRTFARNFDSKGNFEMHGVLPGSYLLVADLFEDGRRLSARVPVEVGSANVDGIVVSLGPIPDVTGKVTAEGNADTKGAALHVRLDPMSSVAMGGAAGGQVSNDSTFRFQNVSPDVYQVNVLGTPENFYLKSVRFGDADITDSGLDFMQGTQAGELSVLISPNGGQVEGSVENAKGDPAGAAIVVLIPDAPRRQLQRYYKTANADQNGHFTIKGIPPGEYKLFAWEQVEYGAYQDPDFLKPFESSGESVSISEKSHETKHLKAIPAESTQN
jgi:hypothetical protein